MGFKQIVIKSFIPLLSSFLAPLILLLGSPHGYAASPDAAHVQMLREIYTKLNEANCGSEDFPQVSIEEELTFFKDNVQNIDSAFEFIEDLHSFTHPKAGFDNHAKLHPYLEKIRARFTSSKNILGLVQKKFDPSVGEDGTTVGGLAGGSVLVPLSVFLYGAWVIDQFRDASNFPNFNANYQLTALSDVSLTTLGGVCVAVPLVIYASKEAYKAACEKYKGIMNAWCGALMDVPLELSEVPTLKMLANTIQTELGIRHISSVLINAVGARVLVRTCSNEFESCPICLENFKGFKGTVATECCRKKYDRSCLEQWFKETEAHCNGRGCPSCRAQLQDESPLDLDP